MSNYEKQQLEVIDELLQRFGDFDNESNDGRMGWNFSMIQLLEKAERTWKQANPGKKTYRELAKIDHRQRAKEIVESWPEWKGNYKITQYS